MIKAKKINDVIVEPIDTGEEPTNVKGCHLFPTLNANILIIAPKNSGKTVNVYKILSECAGKKTHVIIFCATVNNDKMWQKIKEMLRKKKIKYSAFTSIYTDTGINILNTFIKTLQESGNANDDEYDPTAEKLQKKEELLVRANVVNFGEPIATNAAGEIVIRKPKKPKWIAPDYIVIFDDLSSELKDPSIPAFMKMHRHFSNKTIISTQSYIDADSKIRKGNFDYVLLYKGIPEDVLEKIHAEQSITLPFDAFLKLYHHATKEKYHFLLFDRVRMIFRKDYNKEYELSDI